jgi:EmrB/QacA subfamily drug resistance transporter
VAQQTDAAKRLTLAATALGSALAFLDATVVVVALPTMERDLDLGLTGQQWVYLGYALSLASLYLVGGAIGDRVGLRRTFVMGTLVFAAASALCAAAPDEAWLITARVIQGVGGALLTTTSLALLRVVWGDDAGRAIGLWTSLTSVATVIGPPSGGALVEWVSWRWIFIINLPLAALTIVLAAAGRCDEQRVDRRPLDVVGAALSAAGLAALTFTLVEGAERGFGAVWWAARAAVVVLGALVVWTLRAEEPLLPLSLFSLPNVAAANIVTFLVYAALGAFLVYVPIYLQFLGFSPFEAGLVLTPTSLVLAFLAPTFGGLADRHGPRRYVALGCGLIGGGLLLLALVEEQGDFWSAGIAALALFSLGLAALVAPITATAIGSAPERLAGMASGVNQSVARIGGLVAVAAIGLVVTVAFTAAGGPRDADPLGRGGAAAAHDASVDAFRSGMVVAALLALAGGAVAATWIRDAAPAVPEPAAGV